ncbi:hypothetical protein EDD11_006055 [Mortierella claussenii]|nr:hypothetical protein EDD11_006055 [Mortierella claussenii]
MAQGSSKTTSSLSSLVPPSSSSSSDGTVTIHPVEPVPSHLLCVICTLPYENPVHFLPCCHVFCLECIQLWIGMNLSDDLLQNELRRAYPVEGDVMPRDAIDLSAEDMSLPSSSYQSQRLQQRSFMFELTSMNDSRPRSETSNFYSSFDHLTTAQRQLLQQQQTQQRIAVLLESREMPKCPMCRTGLQINGWDRIEEQIKVPVSVSPRPRPSTNYAGSTTSSSVSSLSDRQGRTGGAQRPVSGVERRRARSDRLASDNLSGRREEVIGEEEEEDEEIEMEHVGTSPRHTDHSGRYTGASFPYRSYSSDQNQNERITMGNEDQEEEEEEMLSPTTAVIGRRPSEWMRYQQRQIQAQQERLQANRRRANANVAAATIFAGGHSDQNETLHPHAAPGGDRHDDREEQIRRLYVEQESQAELLRTLSVRAASIINRQERESGQSESSPASSSLPPTAIQASLRSSGEEDNVVSENVGDLLRPQPRHSLLQIDTSLSRPSSRHNQDSQNASNHFRQVSRDNSRMPESELSQHDGSAVHNQDGRLERSAQEEDVANVAINRQNEGQGSQDLSLTDDEGVSDSVSDSTRPSSGSPSPDLGLSPSNDSEVSSFGTLSSFSQNMANDTTVGTPFSQRSSAVRPSWESHTMQLQMPRLEAVHNIFESSGGELHPEDDAEETEYADRCASSLWETNCDGEDERHGLSGCRDSFISRPIPADRGITLGKTNTSDAPAPRIAKESIDCEPLSSTAVTAAEGDALTACMQGSSSGARANLLVTCTSTGKVESSSVSPLIRDLDIQSPDAATVEGTLTTTTTIADVHIDTEILARARSISIIRSDGDDEEESPIIRERPSPVDSPIPTPSTARPLHHRFPAGITLVDGSDQDNTDGEDEEPDHETVSLSARDDSTVTSSAMMSMTEDTQAADGASLTTVCPPNNVTEEHPMDHVITANDDSSVTQSISQEAILPLVDPLNTATTISGTETPSSTAEAAVVEDDAPAQAVTPLVGSSRTAMLSPPPLPQPLLATVQDLEPEVPSTSPLYIHQGFGQLRDEVTVATVGSAGHYHNTNSEGSTEMTRSSGVGLQTDSVRSLPAHFMATTATLSSLRMPTPVQLLTPSLLDSHDAIGTRRTAGLAETGTMSAHEHIQYRTLVRYQPRLPKAHVMSDLISQTRVECPYRDAGCGETMDLQSVVAHGRDGCSFRWVMCPRPHCGLWMRADRIVDHVVMVEQQLSTGTSSSSSSSSIRSRTSTCSRKSSFSGSDVSAPSARVASRSLRQAKNNNSRNTPRSLRSLRRESSSSSSSAFKAYPSDAPTTISATNTSAASSTTTNNNPLIAPCAGLTWEREQLARATGIIGQLTEENTSLRQMIRQLTVQNANLMKDKDRWQRYANLGGLAMGSSPVARQ